MAATALVKDVLWRISVQLQDHSPQFSAWTERELVHWLNDAQEVICTYLPLMCSRTDSIRLTPGTRQSVADIASSHIIHGDGSSASRTYGKQVLGFRRNMGSNGATPGNAIRQIKRDQLDALEPAWHTTTGTPIKNACFDPQTPREFYVYPGVPSAGAWWIELAYTAKPATIPNTGSVGSELYLVGGASTQAITIDDETVPMLVDYVLGRALRKEGKGRDAQKAAEADHRFLGSFNAKMTAVTGNNPNLTIVPNAGA